SIIAGVELSALKKAIPYLNSGLVIMCIVTLFTVKNIESQAKYQTKTLLLKNHLNQVESILKNTELQRHEYARHMQTIQALIELNRIEAAKEYINGITCQYWSGSRLLNILCASAGFDLSTKSDADFPNGFLVKNHPHHFGLFGCIYTFQGIWGRGTLEYNSEVHLYRFRSNVGFRLPCCRDRHSTLLALYIIFIYRAVYFAVHCKMGTGRH
ncbi:MAG: Spo0B domain-containing protein, partial [Syntrophomonas sp.]